MESDFDGPDAPRAGDPMIEHGPAPAVPRGPLARFASAAAEGSPGLWRLPLVVLLSFLGPSILLLAAIFSAALILEPDEAERFILELDSIGQGGGSPIGAPLALGFIALMIPFVWGAVRLFHGRPGATLLGPERRLKLSEAFRGAITIILVLSASVALSHVLGVAPLSWRGDVPGMSATTRVALALAIILLLPLQCLAEELLFRGYLLQETARRWRSPIAWAIAPSLLFGMIHFNAELPTLFAASVIVSTTIFGLCAAFLTARSGDLSLAWGVHVGNNLVALLAIEGPFGLGGPALLSQAMPLGWSEQSLFVATCVGSAIELAIVYWLLTRRMPRGDGERW